MRQSSSQSSSSWVGAVGHHEALLLMRMRWHLQPGLRWMLRRP